MSAKLEMEATSWAEMDRGAIESGVNDLTAIEIESLLRNMDQRNVVAPLREAHAAVHSAGAVNGEGARKSRAALALQEQWSGWLAEREILREEIKRGTECLERVREELAATRPRLEDWAAYERECGKNPLFHYVQSLWINERIENFLPGWLERRERKLAALRSEMEIWARENGMAEQAVEIF